MPDSKRLTVLKAITAQIETVTLVNGYQHDLLGKVHRGRVSYGGETIKPFVSIFEVRPKDNGDRADETVVKSWWDIGVQGVVAAVGDHPTDSAHNLLADMRKALAQIMRPDSPVNRNPDHMFGGLINDMIVDGGVAYVPEDDPGVALCVLKLSIDLTENLENPYEI